MPLTQDDLIPDGALDSASGDKLDHNSVAIVIADLVCSVRASANVALFGPWGSGKSSLFALIKARLDGQGRQDIKVVRYDAWKFAGPGLHRNFLSEVVRQLNLSDRDKAHIEGGVETVRLRLFTYFKRNWKSLLGALAVALIVAAGWITFSAWAKSTWLPGSKAPDFWEAAVAALPGGGAAFGLVIAALLFSNQALASAVEKRTKSPLQDADQFFAAFDQMMDRVTRARWIRKNREVRRLVVFVDELDRCSPDTVVDSLIQLMTYLGHPKCVFVVAADREVLEEALEKAPQAKPIRENEPYYSTSGAFLDKVFQHQLTLPPTRPEALTVFALGLAEGASGLWKDLRDRDRKIYEDAVYALVPSHVRSPRRVKVLMNDFVTAVKVMEQRGLSWRDRVVQVAILTVLQTEFPSVARDFLVQPRLLDALTGTWTDLSDELKPVVERYSPENDSTVQSPSPLLSDSVSAEAKQEATTRLNEQLHAYLRRMHAAGIEMPTPDLVYVQTAAHADGLSDERLSRMLDIAADTAPEVLVSAFADAAPDDRLAAVRFLVAQLGNKFGPLRANLIEAAANIALLLDANAARETARFAAAPILSETRSGRWRPGATVGALWLGLLDEQGLDPIGALAPTGELDRLAESGHLGELLPRLASFGDRADELFPYIGGAFSEHPDLLCSALQHLPAATANRLWESQGDVVDTWLLGQAASKIANAAQGVTDPDPEQDAVETYSALVDAICSRTSSDLGEVAVSVVNLAIGASTLPLVDVVWERRDALRDAMTGSGARNDCALALIRVTTEPERLATWSEWLIDEGASPDLAASACEHTVRQLVVATDPEARASLADVVAEVAGWLRFDGADAVAQVVHDALNSNPPDGTKARRELRASCRRVLTVLEAVFPEPGYVDGYFLQSHLEAIESGSVAVAGVPDWIDEIQSLSGEKAAHLDRKIADSMATGNDAGSLLRLRVAARHRASLPPLAAADIATASDAALVTEWIATRPPLREWIQLIRSFRPTATHISTYSRSKNVSERSRLWIAMERGGWEDDELRAVGQHGVNETVVAHMEKRVKDSTLSDQGAATKRLLTANLAHSTPVRSAANDLALALLKGKIGAGPNAAKIAIASRGAAPKRIDEMRTAFDAYIASTTSNPIPKVDLRALDELHLFTRRKKSRLARLLGWG